MNNLVIGLKRFFTNKNVVTIILVIVILIVLYWGYTTSIKTQTNPVNMPVAAGKITAKHMITESDITYKNIPQSMISENTIRYANQIIGMYTNVNVTIPSGSLFYKDWLISGKELPGNWIEQLDIKNGELGYYMDVDVSSTLGNNVLPDTYIDIYMKAEDENGTVMFGKLMKNVKILAVHDSSGNNVFSNTSDVLTPSKIGFAVKPDMYITLHKSEYVSGIELIIAPRGATVPSENYTIVTSATLRDYIDAHATTIEEDIIDDVIDAPDADPNVVTTPNIQ